MEPIEINTFRPRMKVLDTEQVWAIHAAALEILEKTGFKMEHAGARNMLVDAGCSVDEREWMRMPSYIVEEALRSAPGQIVLYDQLGEPAMSLMRENCYFGTGSDTIFTWDLDTGERRRTVLRDVGRFARLVDGLDNMAFSMSMGNPDDVPIENIYTHVFAEMMRESTKPIIFIADSGRDIRAIHEIASLVAGGEEQLRLRPFILNYSEAISPLRFPVNVMEKLIFCAQKGIPICLPSGCNAGGGGPVTLAGAIALGVAENLVGLVVHQLAGKGSPFLFAPNVSVLDMKRSVISYGCTEWSLTQAALADMRDEIYGIPVWAFAGATDSKLVDAQAGAEGMLSIITAMLSRCNVIHDVGYIESGNTSSMEMLVMADELAGMSRYFVEGIPVTENTLALEVIEKVASGPDASMFLTEDHTFENFKTAHYMPELMDRSRYEVWQKEGSKDMSERCHQRAVEIIENHEVPPKPEKLIKEIQGILEKSKQRRS